MSTFKNVVNIVSNVTDIANKGDNAVQSVNKLWDSTAGKIFKKDMKITEDDVRFEDNIRKILRILEKEYTIVEKEECNEKMLGMKKLIPITLLLRPDILTIYAGYKLYKNHKNNKVQEEKLQKDLITFKYLFTELGFEEKFNDVLYKPTIEEINVLYNEYVERRDDNLLELLYYVCNK